jgi:hypothetical protein
MARRFASISKLPVLIVTFSVKVAMVVSKHSWLKFLTIYSSVEIESHKEMFPLVEIVEIASIEEIAPIPAKVVKVVAKMPQLWQIDCLPLPAGNCDTPS